MSANELRVGSRYERRVGAHYERLANGASLTEKTRFMNVGYWRDRPGTLDEAARALVRLVGRAAQLGPRDRLLDVGCGFADQDILWVEEFAVRRIDAINISPYQIREAETRVRARKLAERIRFRLASGTELPFDGDCFDKVACIEAAHHFDTREDFFREAYRVLRPGGTLVAADILLREGRRLGPFSRHVMHFPKYNAYAIEAYEEKLSEVGFTDLHVQSIREDVFLPFADFLGRRFASRLSKGGKRMALVQRLAKGIVAKATRCDNLDFVIAVAQRRS